FSKLILNFFFHCNSIPLVLRIATYHVPNRDHIGKAKCGPNHNSSNLTLLQVAVPTVNVRPSMPATIRLGDDRAPVLYRQWKWHPHRLPYRKTYPPPNL